MAANTHPHYNPTISSTAQSLTTMGFSAAEVAGATRCWITGVGGDLRYRLHGTAPTATFGHIIKDEVTSELTGEISTLQLIAQTVDVVVTIELDTHS